MLHLYLVLRVVDLDLLLTIIHINYSLLSDRLLISCPFKHTLLHELLSIELLSYLNTQFQVLGHETLELFGSHGLPFSFVLNIVVVLDDFFATFPVHLYDVGHELAFSLKFNFLLPYHLFLVGLFFVEIPFTVLDHLFGITLFLFAFLHEVVCHPLGLLEKEVPVCLSG
jgi:hypothetical protein